MAIGDQDTLKSDAPTITLIGGSSASENCELRIAVVEFNAENILQWLRYIQIFEEMVLKFPLTAHLSFRNDTTTWHTRLENLFAGAIDYDAESRLVGYANDLFTFDEYEECVMNDWQQPPLDANMDYIGETYVFPNSINVYKGHIQFTAYESYGNEEACSHPLTKEKLLSFYTDLKGCPSVSYTHLTLPTKA